MIGWFAGNMVWASAAMLLVLAIRRPVAAAFGAGAAYALWLIPLLRLLAPPAEWLAALFPATVPALPPLPPLILFVEEGAPAVATAPLAWLPVLAALWATGVLLFLAWQVLAYRRFLATLARSGRETGRHRGVRLVESAMVEGPLALGLLDRRIVVPAEFMQRYSPSERSLALDHERHHHRRGDILANHVALAVLALNWCNPIAWLAFRAFRADQEYSCDAAIAASATPAARRDYARALVKSASVPGLLAACPLNSADQLKRRLKMMNRHRRSRRRLIAGSAVTSALVAGSMMLGSPGLAERASAAPAAAQGEGNADSASLAALEPQRARIVDGPVKQPRARSERPRERRSEERVIIMEHRDSDERPRGDDEGAAVRTRRDGRVSEMIGRNLSPELAERIRRCEGEPMVNVDEGDDNRRTRVLVCNRNGGDGMAGSAEALRRVRERLADQDQLSAEARRRVLEQIDQAIARARRD